MNFSLKLFLFVWQEVDFDVGVWASSHVHRGELWSLNDANNQLEKNVTVKESQIQKRMNSSHRVICEVEV